MSENEAYDSDTEGNLEDNEEKYKRDFELIVGRVFGKQEESEQAYDHKDFVSRVWKLSNEHEKEDIPPEIKRCVYGADADEE